MSSSDQSALSSALDDIDASLTSGQKANQSSGPPSPDDLQSKIEDLISSQVDSGKLTSDQADELADIFSQTFSDDGADVAGRPGGPRGPGGPGGPPPGPPPGGGPESADASSSTDSTSTLLQDFLKLIQQQQSTSYSSSASATSSSSLSSLLFDFSA